jgi:ATP-dependent Clp protease protease subunit
METKRTMVNLLTADTGRTVAEIERAIAYDNYMNAKEAVDFGICDLIVERV